MLDEIGTIRKAWLSGKEKKGIAMNTQDKIFNICYLKDSASAVISHRGDPTFNVRENALTKNGEPIHTVYVESPTDTPETSKNILALFLLLVRFHETSDIFDKENPLHITRANILEMLRSEIV